ncbi:hypothetical protein ACSMFR_03870 [Listeria aquatica]|uniref:hypothetical protein n=1 Tax=Listeria aquatica TaxID=1494960 RepID=UPI003F729C65
MSWKHEEKIISSVKKIIDMNKSFPNLIVFGNSKFHFFFEEVEAVYLEEKVFWQMVKDICQKTNDSVVYLITRQTIKKGLLRWNDELKVKNKIHINMTTEELRSLVDFEQMMDDFPLLWFYIYFPSEKAIIVVDEYIELAMLGLEKSIQIKIPWYAADKVFEVEGMDMSGKFSKNFQRKIIYNYDNSKA